MSWARSALFNALFFGWTSLCLVLALPLVAVPREMMRRAARLWAHGVVALLRLTVGIRHELRGDAALLRQPVIVAAKHQSAWDTMIFYLLAADPAYVLKRELTRIPLYGWYAVKQGMIPIDRAGGAAALKRMVAAARRALAEGRQVVIFPQGTRVAPGADAPYQPGVAALYLQLGVPVVPVALNSGLLWGRRSFVKRPGTIAVDILEPIPAGLSKRAFLALLEERIETATRGLGA